MRTFVVPRPRLGDVGQGRQNGKVSTDEIAPGKFRIFIEVSSDKFSIAFRLKFKT